MPDLEQLKELNMHLNAAKDIIQPYIEKESEEEEVPYADEGPEADEPIMNKKPKAAIVIALKKKMGKKDKE